MFITDVEIPVELNSQIVNSIEKKALYIAAQNDGKLYPSQLLPYFSLSLKALDDCVQNMVDNSSILTSTTNNISCYEFSHLSDDKLPKIDLVSKRLAYDEPNKRQTKIEHQIFHAAANFNGRTFAESIAVQTDFTLNEIKATLQKLSVDKYISQEFDEEDGSIFYTFPKIDYNEKNFKLNMKFLVATDSQESFDATAGVFFKYMVICTIMIGLMFFAKVNFRFLIFLFILSLPVSAIMTYFNQKK